MPQFFLEPSQIKEDRALLTGEEAKHLARVLRHQVGDWITVSDGKNRWRAEILEISPKQVLLKLSGQKTVAGKHRPPTLGIALLKHDHLELALQKCVELGVEEFFLLETERTIPHYGQEAGKKMARFNKIALEAAKQSGMVAIPRVAGPIHFAEFCKQWSEFDQVLMAWELEAGKNLRDYAKGKSKDLTPALLLIGPEGGWTDEEVALARQHGAQTVGLGNQILRAETAAIVIATLYQYEVENL